jgi:hypothetical protein
VVDLGNVDSAGATGPENLAFGEDQLSTEAAQEAYRQSTLLQSCRWEIARPAEPIDVAVLAIDPAVEESLRGVLAESPGVTDFSSGEIAAFAQQWEHGTTSSHGNAFADGYWVVVNGSSWSNRAKQRTSRRLSRAPSLTQSVLRETAWRGQQRKAPI